MILETLKIYLMPEKAIICIGRLEDVLNVLSLQIMVKKPIDTLVLRRMKGRVENSAGIK